LFKAKLSALAKNLIPPLLLRRLDPFEAAIHDFVHDAAAATPRGALVLDAGAGECRFKSWFRHASYVGVDFAQGDPAWDYSNLDAVANLEQLPFAGSSFDRILAIVVLEHTPQPWQVTQELQRVLKPGGKLYIVVPHMWEEHQKPHDFFRFTSAGVRYLLESAGIRIDRIEPIGGFFWQLGRRLTGVLAFAQQGWRWVLFPVLAPVFGFILPLCCYYLDGLDRDRAYTLGFVCEGSRQ
jgi:SAM-dependent methyltransferase